MKLSGWVQVLCRDAAWIDRTLILPIGRLRHGCLLVLGKQDVVGMKLYALLIGGSNHFSGKSSSQHRGKEMA